MNDAAPTTLITPPATPPLTRPTLGRRQFLFGGAALALAACTSKSGTGSPGATATSTAHTTDPSACYTLTTDTSAATLQEVMADATVSTEGFNLLWIPPIQPNRRRGPRAHPSRQRHRRSARASTSRLQPAGNTQVANHTRNPKDEQPQLWYRH